MLQLSIGDTNHMSFFSQWSRLKELIEGFVKFISIRLPFLISSPSLCQISQISAPPGGIPVLFGSRNTFRKRMVIAVRPPYKIMSLAALRGLYFTGLVKHSCYCFQGQKLLLLFLFYCSLFQWCETLRELKKNENKMLTEMRALSGQTEFTMTR